MKTEKNLLSWWLEWAAPWSIHNNENTTMSSLSTAEAQIGKPFSIKTLTF